MLLLLLLARALVVAALARSLARPPVDGLHVVDQDGVRQGQLKAKVADMLHAARYFRSK
jgi:hypothetical protein